MTPVIHCSAGNILFFPRTALVHRKGIQLTKHNGPGNYTRLASSSRGFLLSQSLLRPLQIYPSGYLSNCGSRSQIIAAIGTDVALEEPNPAPSEEDADKTLDARPNAVEANDTAPNYSAVVGSAKSKRPKPVRKSDMPPVKNEDVVPGASFTGKVRSIQPFGAFVDFGAFTDGLVHVSRMSDGYVKDVGALVSIGQEVKVSIVEANMETGRISLTMRDTDDAQQRTESPAGGSSDRPRPARKNVARSNQRYEDGQKGSKFVKGQVLDGTVKNLTRSGAFVSLPDGKEGFIPVSEESEGFGNVIGNSSLQVGQEVNVRVLRISRGQVTLTMKKEEDIEGLNKKLNQGVVHVATNPFELAFRKNKDIATFLDEREKAHNPTENITSQATSGRTGNELDDTITKSDTVLVDGSNTSGLSHEVSPLVESIPSELVNGDEEPVSNMPQSSNTVLENLSEDSDSSKTLMESSSDSVSEKVPTQDELQVSSTLVDTVEEKDSNSQALSSEESESSLNGSSANLVTDGVPVTNEIKEADIDTKPVEENKEVSTPELPIVDEVLVTDEVKEANVINASVTEDEASSKNLSAQEITDSADFITDRDPTGAVADQVLSSDEILQQVDGTETDRTVENDKLKPEVENEVASAVNATISPALVKQLREETGAGMMDCKKALSETEGDIVKAQEFLRKKGLASADKKATRVTAEGRIGSYIHDSRIGVLVEVNCETDFVSRGEIFKQLVDDLAMQVAACPQVRYLVTEDVPEEIVNKEREIEMQKEDLLTKPEHIRSKIVDGRIGKRLADFALLEQPYVKNDKMVVKDWVKQTIATIGENIRVKRFVRYNLGEGLEKKSQDFAAEVAAQTARKESPEVPKEQPAETKEIVEKPPAIAVSAALVKQLREETGAGMMDCKKALTESGADLEKAQEYLRKKGLSSADKKSSRMAAEGRISSYIHDSRIGVLIEVNCETDFVGRNERFKALVDDLAMQLVACPQVEFVSVEDIPESIVNKEKEIEMQREDLRSKPENIRQKIVEGRISKRLGELALLEQPFLKDDSVMVKDLVKQTVVALGENIRVRRFVRFTLGENE